MTVVCGVEETLLNTFSTDYNHYNAHEIEILQDNIRLFCFFNAERREALREK